MTRIYYIFLIYVEHRRKTAGKRGKGGQFSAKNRGRPLWKAPYMIINTRAGQKWLVIYLICNSSHNFVIWLDLDTWWFDLWFVLILFASTWLDLRFVKKWWLDLIFETIRSFVEKLKLPYFSFKVDLANRWVFVGDSNTRKRKKSQYGQIRLVWLKKL